MKFLPKRYASWLVAICVLGCALGVQAAVTPVRLITENVALSVWEDGVNVGVALQLKNDSAALAKDVKVTSVTLRGGTVQNLVSLPQSLGDLPPLGDSMLNLKLSVPRTDGTRYLLTVNGSYTYAGAVYGFSLNRYLIPRPAPIGPIPTRDGLSAVQHPNNVVYPPPPPVVAFEPNAETPILIPPGPPRQVFPSTPTPSPIAGANSAGALTQVNVNTSQVNAGVPPDPSAAATANNVVLSTYNTGISYSTDGGARFTDVNLNASLGGTRTSFFPQSDGGICCDQVVIYVPQQNLFVWLIQYWPITGCVSGCGGPTPVNGITTPNRLRVAWATPQAVAANFSNAWTYADLTANNVPGVSSGLGTTAAEWLDYPDLAYSGQFLYVGVDHGFPTPGQVYAGRRIVARLNLAQMANPASTVINYNFTEYTGSNGLNKSHFVQNAPARMVLGSLDNQSTLRIFTWRDTDAAPSPQTVGVSSITTAYNSVAPDNTDWYATSFPGNITGAAFRSVIPGLNVPSQPQYLFAFDAGVNAAGNRPRAYVRIETITLVSIPILGIELYVPVEEYDVWNPDYAYAMAALGTASNDIVRPDIGIALAVGGGTLGYPQFAVGFKDDFVVYQVTSSNATQVSRFGDYIPARNIPGTGLFAAEVYDVLQNVSGSNCAVAGCRAVMRYVQFGRPPFNEPR